MVEEIKRPKPTTYISEEFYADDRQYYTVVYPTNNEELPTRLEGSD